MNIKIYQLSERVRYSATEIRDFMKAHDLSYSEVKKMVIMADDDGLESLELINPLNQSK